MKNNIKIKSLIILILLVVSIPVSAQKTQTNKVKGKVGSNASTTAENFVKAQSKAVEMIDKRIESLKKLSARLNEIKKISIDQKTSLTAEIQAEILSLTDLRLKISSESATSTLKIDTKSITEGHRIFALVEPKIQILASADRELIIADMLDVVLNKINARIASSTVLMGNTKIKTLIDEMGLKIADIRVQANAAIALVTPLKPDNGDKTVMASNTKALKDAKDKIHTGKKDIEVARKNAKEVSKVIKESLKRM